MQTSWEELRVRDAHAHLFTRRFFETMAGMAPPDWLVVPDPVENLAHEMSLDIPREPPALAMKSECDVAFTEERKSH